MKDTDFIIKKMVREYVIWELNISPYAKFKIKIYFDGSYYIGEANIKPINIENQYCVVLGEGDTEQEALDKTINCFFELTKWKKEWYEEDFDWINPNVF